MNTYGLPEIPLPGAALVALAIKKPGDFPEIPRLEDQWVTTYKGVGVLAIVTDLFPLTARLHLIVPEDAAAMRWLNEIHVKQAAP